MGIVQAMITANDGNITFLSGKPAGNALREATELIVGPVRVSVTLVKQTVWDSSCSADHCLSFQ